MRVDTVRIGYSDMGTKPIGYFEASLSPDGWQNSRYVNNTDKHLFASEIAEFSDFVRSFMHDLPTQTELHKYATKHGADTDAVTRSFRFECALLVYLVHVTGYNVVFEPYRKENV